MGCRQHGSRPPDPSTSHRRRFQPPETRPYWEERGLGGFHGGLITPHVARMYTGDQMISAVRWALKMDVTHWDPMGAEVLSPLVRPPSHFLGLQLESSSHALGNHNGEGGDPVVSVQRQRAARQRDGVCIEVSIPFVRRWMKPGLCVFPAAQHRFLDVAKRYVPAALATCSVLL